MERNLTITIVKLGDEVHVQLGTQQGDVSMTLKMDDVEIVDTRVVAAPPRRRRSKAPAAGGQGRLPGAAD